MLVTVVCDLLVASEQLLCTIRECTSQAAVTGLVCQQCLILLGIHSLGGQGEGVLALSLVGRIEGEQVPVTSFFISFWQLVMPPLTPCSSQGA